MIKFSKRKVLNTVLNKIYDELMEMGVDEIKRYMNEFPMEVDYNIYQYGNVLIWDYDIEQLYKNAGYISKFNYREAYKRQVGHVARYIVRKESDK